ncbi:diguanylate cyclase [Actinotalea sp.]|uniref:diguanylate cyclase n=1 Tax=Actinotalea sp. TaxID=1872145 RepID=UPI003567CDB4
MNDPTAVTGRREGTTVHSVPTAQLTTPARPCDRLPLEIDELEVLLHADPHACATRAADAVECARGAGDLDAEMRLSWIVASAYRLLGRDGDALAAADRTEQLAERAEDLSWQSRALSVRGLVHHDLGQYEDAVDHLHRAIALRRLAEDTIGAAEVLNDLGLVYTAMPQFAPQALQSLENARRTWIAAGETDMAAVAQTNLARHYVVTAQRLTSANPRGAVAAARRAAGVAQQAIDEADAAGLTGAAIDARIALATAHLLAKDLGHCGSALEATSAMLERFPSDRARLALRGLHARWLLETGAIAEAVAEAETGVAQCHAMERPTERLGLLETLVAAREAAGDTTGALDALHELHELSVELNAAVAERRAVLLSSRLDIERAEREAEAQRRRARQLEAHNEALAWQASHDALTGLPNRRTFDETISLWQSADMPFALATIDIDHFKAVNDTLSHQVGDDVLARVSATIAGAVRDRDLAARYGGEEFVLLIADADLDAATAVCERIRTSVSALTWPMEMPRGRITVSVGLTVWDGQASTETLLSRSDAALYAAKGAGRDRTVVG